MSDRDATEALIRRCVAAFTAGGMERLLVAGRERRAPVTTCHNPQDRIVRLALG
jgi:hypothetical protein